MSHYQSIIRPILAEYPEIQAIYLFGSWGTDEQLPDSDLELALLLPVKLAKLVAPWEWLALAARIAEQVGVAQVDLINIRSVDTVFRREIIAAERQIYCADEHAAAEFEMLTLSFYQQLQEERRDIIRDAVSSGRFRHA